MRTFVCSVFVAALCLSATAQDQAKAREDWKRLDELHQVFNTYFVSEYNQSDKGAEFIQVWKEWSAEAPDFVAYFAQTYGATSQEVFGAFDGLEPLDGVINYPMPLATSMYEIDFDTLQTQVGQWLVNTGDKHMSDHERMTGDELRDLERKMQFAERALEAYRGAVEVNPEGDYAEHIAKAEQALKDARAAWEKNLDAVEWPGHNADFEGPGDPDTLAAAALKFLEKLRDEGRSWTKPEYDDEHIPLAACVIADMWGVEKTAPLTQEPTQFRLKVLVAFRGEKDPDLVYCYPMFFYTKEERGVEKAPPFYYCNSQQYASFRMPMAKLGEGGGVLADSAPAAVAARRPGQSLVVRLLLAAGLLTAGLAATSGQVLAAKVAPLGGAHAALKATREQVGWGVLVIGALALFLSLVRLAIFRDLLPQAAAICLGLALLSKGVPAQGEAPEGQEQPAQSESPLSKAASALAPFEKELGLAALVLGILHLLAGGFPFI